MTRQKLSGRLSFKGMYHGHSGIRNKVNFPTLSYRRLCVTVFGRQQSLTCIFKVSFSTVYLAHQRQSIALMSHSASTLTANQSQRPTILIPHYLLPPSAVLHHYCSCVRASRRLPRASCSGLPIGLLSPTRAPFQSVLHSLFYLKKPCKLYLKLGLSPLSGFQLQLG